MTDEFDKLRELEKDLGEESWIYFETLGASSIKAGELYIALDSDVGGSEVIAPDPVVMAFIAEARNQVPRLLERIDDLENRLIKEHEGSPGREDARLWEMRAADKEHEAAQAKERIAELEAEARTMRLVPRGYVSMNTHKKVLNVSGKAARAEGYRKGLEDAAMVCVDHANESPNDDAECENWYAAAIECSGRIRKLDQEQENEQ